MGNSGELDLPAGFRTLCGHEPVGCDRRPGGLWVVQCSGRSVEAKEVRATVAYFVHWLDLNLDFPPGDAQGAASLSPFAHNSPVR